MVSNENVRHGQGTTRPRFLQYISNVVAQSKAQVCQVQILTVKKLTLTVTLKCQYTMFSIYEGVFGHFETWWKLIAFQFVLEELSN